MSFNIPLNIITSEAAIIGAATLSRFLTLASRDMAKALGEIDAGKENPSIGDIKEAFYTHLYKKLLQREFSQLTEPRAKKSTPYGQEFECVLDTASGVILNLHGTDRQSASKTNLSDAEILEAVLKNFEPARLVKYFYASFLSSIYAFYLSKKMANNLAKNKDYQNAAIYNNYLNARVKHCQATIYHYLYQIELNQEALNTADEDKTIREVKKIVRKLKNEENFATKSRHRYRPLTRYVLCGDTARNERILGQLQLPTRGIAGRIIKLDASEPDGNINLRIDQIEQTLDKNLSLESRDLLEIAGYIYVGDTQISRGPRWRRSIYFVIPVRRLSTWQSLAPFLSYSLSFLSGDSIMFEFCEYGNETEPKEMAPAEGKTPTIDSICLFSGGADSFAATLTAIRDTPQPVIVSHFAQNSLAHLQGDIVDSLVKLYGKTTKRLEGEKQREETEPPEEINHLRINLGKKRRKNRKEKRLLPDIESTQRTRSFLYFSLASVIAAELGLPEIRIKENGIQCFNLPITPAFVSTRCGRPTHPRNVYNFNQIVKQLYGQEVLLHNTYVLKTKAELLKEAIKSGDEEALLNKTTSCPRYSIGILFDERRKKRKCLNCGTCYSCILRLVAISGAGIKPDYEKYLVNPLLQTDKLKSSELATLVRFMSFCIELKTSSRKELLFKYPELCLPECHFPDAKGMNITDEAIKMHERFADESLAWVKQGGTAESYQMLGMRQDIPGEMVDVHCHIDQYKDPFYILAKAKHENLRIVSVATNLRSTRASFEMANYFDSIIPCAGLHPLYVPEFRGDLDRLFKYIDEAQFIGEIGLDYYHQSDLRSRSLQRDVFTEILKYCQSKNKILNIHSLYAEKEIMDKLEEFKATKVILHWFSGFPELLPRIIKNGFYISINRGIKFSGKIKNMVAKLPRELILTESDGPTKYRNYQHTPFDVPGTISEIARIWRVPDETARLQIIENFRELTEK